MSFVVVTLFLAIQAQTPSPSQQVPTFRTGVDIVQLDVTVLDKVAIVTLCLLMVALGLFPSLMVPMVQTGVQNIINLLGGA